jgi:predicted dehydrogenase
MGLRHVRVLRELEARFEVVATYDVKDVAVPGDIPRVATDAEALDRAEAVVVATSIASHGLVVGRALAAGKHVLVEKPICGTAAEARAAMAASRGGARLFVGHSERFNPVVRALANLLRAEHGGEPGGGDVRALDFKRLGASKPCGYGVLVNAGVHDFDLAAYLAGGVVLRGAVGAAAPGSDGEDHADVTFCTASGAVGRLAADRRAPARRRSIEVTTTRWIYEGDLLGHRLARRARGKGARARTALPVPADEPLVAQAMAFADALDGRPVRELATGIDGLRALELAERAAALCASSTGPVAEKLSLDVAR